MRQPDLFPEFPRPEDDDQPTAEAATEVVTPKPKRHPKATAAAAPVPVVVTPTPAPATPAAPAANPFDPAALRLGSDFSEGLGVRKVITTIPVRKPSKSEWFRVRPGAEWRLQTAVLEVEAGVERSTYLVAAPLWPDLSGEISPALVLCCVNRANDLFLWRIKLPGPDGRSNTWTESALRIAQAAEGTWCRMSSDTTNGHYSHCEPSVELPEPKWPELTFGAILETAFRDRFIASSDHAVLRSLRGEI